MFHIKNNTRRNVNVSLLKTISNKVLGSKYDLSVCLVTNKTSQKINKTYRQKNKPTNVLSFPLGTKEGEIFLDIQKIKDEARQKNKKYELYFAYIFIHGLLHLKGFDHGSTMEDEEDKLLKGFYPSDSLF